MMIIDPYRFGVAVDTPITILGSKLVAWWNADSTAKLTLSGASVTAWADEISNISLAQATGAAQPQYSATGWNSVAPAVTFDGARYMRTSSIPAAIPTGTNYSEMLWVAEDTAVETDGDATRPLVSYGTTTNGNYREVRRASVTSVSRLRTSDGAALSTYSAASFFGRHYGRCLWNGTQMQGSFDNGTLSTLTNHGSTGTTRIALGNTPAGTATGWVGKIRDIMILNAAPSAGELTAINAYMAGRI